MASSLCRSGLMGGSRSLLVSRSRTVTQKCLNLKPTTTFASVPKSIPPRASRVLSALGSVESMIPLHSAVASARLRSSIAFDSSCWSLLSQGTPPPPTFFHFPFPAFITHSGFLLQFGVV
ncbi:unnamed protein product [Cochlearia groenlandica]